LILSPDQCRIARAILRWSTPHLASIAGLDRITIARFETRKQKSKPETQSRLREVFEQAGIEFGEEGWIRLKPAPVEVSSEPDEA
jgi:hypothetical protein